MAARLLRIVILAIVAFAPGCLLARALLPAPSRAARDGARRPCCPTAKRLAQARARQPGRPARSAQDFFRGGWTMVFFGFTSCPDICPHDARDAAARHQACRPAAGRAAARAVHHGRSGAGRPGAAAAYVRFFDPAFLGATGDAQAVAAAAAAFGVPFARVACPRAATRWTTGPGCSWSARPEQSSRTRPRRTMPRCSRATTASSSPRRGPPMTNRRRMPRLRSCVRGAAGPAAAAPAVAGDASPRAQHQPPRAQLSSAPCCAPTRRSTCAKRRSRTRLRTRPSMRSSRARCARSARGRGGTRRRSCPRSTAR